MTWSAPARVASSAFSRAAHRGEDGRVRPPGELDRGIADGPRATGHQDGPPAQGARPEPGRAVLGHGQAAVGGQERDPQAGPQVVRRRIGQRHHVRLPGARRTPGRCRRQGRRCAASHTHTRRPTRAESTPAPTASTSPAPSWLGTWGGSTAAPGAAAATGLPVGRVHPGAMEPDPHLPRPGLGDRCLHQGQDVGIAGQGVLDCAHAPHRTTWAGIAVWSPPQQNGRLRLRLRDQSSSSSGRSPPVAPRLADRPSSPAQSADAGSVAGRYCVGAATERWLFAARRPGRAAPSSNRCRSTCAAA